MSDEMALTDYVQAIRQDVRSALKRFPNMPPGLRAYLESIDQQAQNALDAAQAGAA